METIVNPKKTKAIKTHTCMYCFQEIEKRTTYLHSVHKYEGRVYAWKSHEACAEIASKLRMYDYADEGLTGEDFVENIKMEYSDLMSKHHTELYESKEFVIPKFKGQLEFVLQHHKIENNNGNN